MATFHVGDRVRIFGARHLGLYTGHIIHIEENALVEDQAYRVRVDQTGTAVVFLESQLELIDGRRAVVEGV